MSKEVVMSTKRRGKVRRSARTEGARRATGGGADVGGLAPGRDCAARIPNSSLNRKTPRIRAGDLALRGSRGGPSRSAIWLSP